MRLVQIQHKDGSRRVAVVDGDSLSPLKEYSSLYLLAQAAITNKVSLIAAALDAAREEKLPYEPIYSGTSEWKLLPPINHPDDDTRCLVTGTGLTHIKSAAARREMHSGLPAEIPDAVENDSARMYRWGLEGGKPAAGQVGVSPEWFYKGNGSIVRACGDALMVPSFAEDGGEEAEIAGVYLIDSKGCPRRLGLTMGNEFSDHVFEKRNYLYLAGSKLRQCALGPELRVDPEFDDVRGTVRIQRQRSIIWSAPLLTGEKHMCHSLANIEHHHFKYPAHRQPGDIHVHFFGADAFSFSQGLSLQDGDVVEIAYPGFGRPLRNPIQLDHSENALVTVLSC